MPKVTPIQESFASGEITPRLIGQIRSPIRASGLLALENMIVLTQGPTQSRGGSYTLDRAENDLDIRMIPYNVARGEDYAIGLTPGKLRIYNGVGRIDTGSSTIVVDGYFQGGGSHWQSVFNGTGSVTFSPPTFSAQLKVEGGGNSDAAVRQQLIEIDAGDVGNIFELTGQASGDGTLHVNIGSAVGTNDILDTDIANGDFTIPFTPTQTQIYLEFINEANNSQSTVGAIAARLFGVAIEIDTPYPAADLSEIQYEMIPAQKILVLVHSSHHPKVLQQQPDNTWSFQDAPFIYDPDTPPGTPIWSENDYPGVVTIHQGRLWLGRSKTQLQTFWASRAGSYFQFYAESTPTDADFLSFTLSSPGEIEWMKGQKTLLMGTNLTEALITAEGGVITPTDINVRVTSAYGSRTLVQARKVEDQVVYVTPDGRKVRAATFKRESEWFSPDITWRAEHITANGSHIQELHFARDPESQILAVTENNQILACAYERYQEVIGWSRQFNDESQFISVCVLNGKTGSVVFIAQKLSNGRMIISVAPPSLFQAPNMDAAYIVLPTVDGTNDVLDGITELEGMTVNITIDGAVHAPQVVGDEGPEGPSQPATPGRVYLQFTGDRALVGLGFTAKMQTFPFDQGSPSGAGGSYIKHWNKVIVRVQNSAKMLINGKRQPERFPSTPMNQPQPALTEDIVVSTLGRDRFALITIEQDLPLPLTVLSLLGEMAEETLG